MIDDLNGVPSLSSFSSRVFCVNNYVWLDNPEDFVAALRSDQSGLFADDMVMVYA